MVPRMTLKSPCLYLPSAEITGVCRHACFKLCFSSEAPGPFNQNLRGKQQGGAEIEKREVEKEEEKKLCLLS